MTAALALTPAEIAASVEAAEQIRRKAPKKAGRKDTAIHRDVASPTFSPLPPAIEIPAAATPRLQPTGQAPQQESHLTAATLPRYEPTQSTTLAINDIVATHRERQANIRAKTKLILQAKALLRSHLCTEADFEDDNTKASAETKLGEKRRKLTDKAQKRVDAAYKEATTDPTSDFGLMIAPYIGGIALFDARQALLEKDMVKLAKTLPAYQWAKSVKGLGDVSFATLVGECGDIGTYKSVAALWKRLGLAVMSGKRQGAPGEGASSQDWIDHGYSGKRRSVSWNARNGIILGMGQWRPLFGEDVRANDELTEYQKVFAERARYESEKLCLPVTESDKGKESYKAHAVARAFRYAEKRMLKHLFLAWRNGEVAPLIDGQA